MQTTGGCGLQSPGQELRKLRVQMVRDPHTEASAWLGWREGKEADATAGGRVASESHSSEEHRGGAGVESTEQSRVLPPSSLLCPTRSQGPSWTCFGQRRSWKETDSRFWVWAQDFLHASFEAVWGQTSRLCAGKSEWAHFLSCVLSWAAPDQFNYDSPGPAPRLKRFS